MTSILIGLLNHQTHVGHLTSGGVVKLTLLLAVLDNGVVDTGVRSIGDDTLDLLELVVVVPHLSSITDDVGHEGIDDIAGDMEVCDSGVNQTLVSWAHCTSLKHLDLFNIRLKVLFFSTHNSA